MKQAIIVALLLLPVTAVAQVSGQQPPTIQSQADAAAMQATRLVGILAGQITADQERIEALQKTIVELQAKAAQAPKSEPAKKD